MADETARQLLSELLGSRREELAKRGYLDVRSDRFPDLVYRLRMQQPIEMRHCDDSRPSHICAVASQPVPPADELLMKLLWLRASETELLSIANRVD